MSEKLIDAMKMEARSEKPCCVMLDFSIPAEAVSREADAAVRNVAGAVSVPGFRHGRAPIGMVKSKYADAIREELERRIMHVAFEMMNKDESREVLGCSLDGEFKVEDGQECKFTFALETAPEFELGDYKACKSNVELDAVSDDQIEERVKFYRSMYGNYAEVEGAAVKDDMLKVSYTSDFVPAENATAGVRRQAAAEDTFLWLADPENIPGSIAALTGAEAGKEYQFKADYPADYREAELAGKSVNYTVKVASVQRRQELSDEELTAKVGVKSISELRDMLRKSMEHENAAKRNEAAAKDIFEQIDAQVAQFDLPEGVFAAETQRELQKLARELVKSEEDAEKFKSEIDAHRAAAEASAKASLRRSFILRKIARLEKIELEKGEVEAHIEQFSRYYGQSAKAFREMLEKSGGMDEFQLDILNAKVLNNLVEAAK